MSIHLAGHESSSWSFSQYGSYLRCGKAFELARIMRAPKLPSWYAIGGLAVHATTEEIDRLEYLMGESSFSDEETVELTNRHLDALITEEQQRSGIDPDRWIAGGKGKEKQRSDYWHTTASALVRAYREWRADTHWDWAVLGDEVAIEVRLEVNLGGLPFIAVLDRLAYLPDGSLAVIDVKTGLKPESALQLGTYATVVELAGFPRPEFGLYWLGKRGTHSTPEPLAMYTKNYLDQIFGEAIEGVRRGAFMPNPGWGCRTCSLADSCFTVNGAQSHLYDRLDPEFNLPRGAS